MKKEMLPEGWRKSHSLRAVLPKEMNLQEDEMLPEGWRKSHSLRAGLPKEMNLQDDEMLPEGWICYPRAGGATRGLEALPEGWMY